MNKLKSYFMEPVSAPLATVILIIFCLACACPRQEKRYNIDPSTVTPSKPTPLSTPINNGSDPASSSDSSNNYFIGTWKVSQANAYMPEYKALTINRNGSYSWEVPVSKETFTGNWRMENGAVILEKAYKGVDWRIKVFKPDNQSDTKDWIWLNGIGNSSQFHEYKGFRAE